MSKRNAHDAIITVQCKTCLESLEYVFSNPISLDSAMTSADHEYDDEPCLTCDTGKYEVISGRIVDSGDWDIQPDDGVFGIGI